MTAMTITDAVGFAWARWDEQPCNVHRIVALQDCMEAWADQTDLTTIELDQRVQEARRTGLDPMRAVAHVEENL